MRKRESAHKLWLRRRRRLRKFKPNDKYLREYEEAMILADMERVGGEFVGPSDLRRLEPGRYSIKLAGVMKRMAGFTGPLQRARGGGRFRQASYRIRDRATMKEAA